MARWRALALFLIAASSGLACWHAHHVEREQERDGATEEGASGKQERGASSKPTRARVPPRAGRPAVSATPEGLMNPGSARRIQDALRAKGLLDEEPSGELDQATSAALRRFQASQDLAATGAPDRETLRRLGVDPQDIYRTVPQGGEAQPNPERHGPADQR